MAAPGPVTREGIEGSFPKNRMSMHHHCNCCRSIVHRDVSACVSSPFHSFWNVAAVVAGQVAFDAKLGGGWYIYVLEIQTTQTKIS